MKEYDNTQFYFKFFCIKHHLIDCCFVWRIIELALESWKAWLFIHIEQLWSFWLQYFTFTIMNTNIIVITNQSELDNHWKSEWIRYQFHSSIGLTSCSLLLGFQRLSNLDWFLITIKFDNLHQTYTADTKYAELFG